MSATTEWKETTLGELADFSNGRTSPARSSGGNFPVFGSNGVIGFSEETNTVENTIIIGRVGSYCGSLYFSKTRCWTTDNAMRGHAKENLSDSYFLWYLLQTLNLNKRSGGSGQPLINQSILNAIEVRVPALNEQRSIAAVLSSLDDKIELLRRQNETLEQVAQAIFNEWFVKPVADGALPAGWRMVGLTNIADFLNGIALQKYTAISGELSLPAIKIRELKAGITEVTDRVSTDVPAQYIVEDGDLLFSWSGSLEVVLWRYGKGALNQHLFKVTSDKYPQWFVYLWLLQHLPDFRAIAANKATTMGHIQRHHLDQAEVVLPDEKALADADVLLAPIFNKIISNNSQLGVLPSIRDILLPRLMSGEIRVGV